MKWASVCNVLERLSSSSDDKRRRVLLRSLLDAARAAGDPFAVLRILLPKRDRIRPQYHLKEAALAQCLLQALALAPTSRDGSRLLAWRTRGGSASGDLSLLAFQVINARQQRRPVGEMSISDLHILLDRLSSSSTREGKTAVLRELMMQTTAEGMKWIVRMILEDMRIGLGEKTILKEFHPDANTMMAFCVDLHLVCIQLPTLSTRFRHQELEVGKALKSQLSKRVTSMELAWDAMKGKRMVAECKFDGDRMQVHKDAETLSFWSRNGLEHAEYNVALGPILQRHIKSKRCVLDGELLVWDCSDERYKPRTGNLNRDTGMFILTKYIVQRHKEFEFPSYVNVNYNHKGLHVMVVSDWHAARAARKGWDSDEQICYVVFDILYEENHGSLLHLPLSDRHTLLQKFVSPCHPRVISILPGSGGSQWSIQPKSKEELFQFFIDVVQRGDEGVIVKDLASQWCPDNRDGRWCKIKPDYLNLGSDLDLLIIGGYYGRGQRGGQIVSYLLALKDQQEAGDIPTRFLSICRCGVGLSGAEQALVQQKISPHFVKNTKKGLVPSKSGYMVTNSRFERPDVWVSSPEKSMVLQVSAEKRVFASSSFKAGWTFRFPRAQKVRDDKHWHDCLSVQEFHEMVASAKARGNSLVRKYEPLPAPKKMKQRKRSRSGNMVPTYLQACDVSNVAQLSCHFQALVFYICRSGLSEPIQNLCARITEAGGSTIMNLEACVTHVISDESIGMGYRAAVSSGRDVINTAWLHACLDSGQLLPIAPRHFLHMSEATKEKQRDGIDAFGDPYTDLIAQEDLCQVFATMESDGPPLNSDVIRKLESKSGDFCRWGMFRGLFLYMLPPIHSTNPDTQAVAQASLRRLGLEASMCGASVSPSLTQNVTHVVVFSSSIESLPFKSIIRSIQPHEQKQIVQQKSVSVVTHCWLLDSLQQRRALSHYPYSLRSDNDLLDYPPLANTTSTPPERPPQDIGTEKNENASLKPMEPNEFREQHESLVLHPREKRHRALNLACDDIAACTTSNLRVPQLTAFKPTASRCVVLPSTSTRASQDPAPEKRLQDFLEMLFPSFSL